MRNVRVFFFGVSALYLAGVVVQFFLAGLGAFGATTFDSHRALGFILAFISLGMLAMVFYIAHEVLQRSRRYLASKTAA